LDFTIFLNEIQQPRVEPFVLDLNRSEPITTANLLQSRRVFPDGAKSSSRACWYICSPMPMRGLIIRSPYIDWILEGKKTWEIRGSNSHVRGKIALIRSGSGLVVGTCKLVGVVGPLTLRELKKHASKLGRTSSEIRSKPYEKTYAWALSNAVRLKHPRRYKHRPGAVIWVRLPFGNL